MMKKMVGISEAAKPLGVTPLTLRQWEVSGKLMPDVVMDGGRQRCDLSRLRTELFRADDRAERPTIAYARVSSHGQKPDLERQAELLEAYCAAQGWTCEVVTDLGSGMNDRKKGRKRLPDDIVAGRVGRLVVTRKDQLLRALAPNCSSPSARRGAKRW